LEKVIVLKLSETGILDIGQFFGLGYSKPEEILQKKVKPYEEQLDRLLLEEITILR
jgi:hypothetical protein